jgi:hypothetical protein
MEIGRGPVSFRSGFMMLCCLIVLVFRHGKYSP